jgi:hypothetical protein
VNPSTAPLNTPHRSAVRICGSGAREPAAAKVTPGMERKNQDTLKEHSKQYNERYRAKR